MAVETITEWQQKQYNDTVTDVYNRTETQITKYIAQENVRSPARGVLVDFPVFGAAVTRDKVDRYEDTVWGNVEKSKRWVRPYKSYQALPLDNYDQARSQISDINSRHTKAIVAALKRAEDKRAITAVNVAAVTGENFDGSAALPSSQVIAIGSTPDDILTLAKIKLASAKFDDGAIPTGAGMRHWFYAPGQKSAILSITQAASSDFTARRIYDKGNIDGDEWMGFLWHMVPDVKNQGADGITTLLRMLPLSSTTRTNFAMASDALGLARVSDIITHLDPLPLKTYTWQAYGEIDVNVVRVLDAGIVTIDCLEQTS
jgi:hypothetical protein